LRRFLDRFSEPELRALAGYWERLDVEEPSDAEAGGTPSQRG
jgi:hypothetical protein